MPAKAKLKNTHEALTVIAASGGEQEGTISIAPDTRQPMGQDLWGKVYAVRNGQLTLLYSVADDEGTKALRTALKPNKPFEGITKDLQYRMSSREEMHTLRSWGDLVEFAVRTGLDLTGLTLSPEQKKHLFEGELKNKNLKEAKISHAVLDGLDLTGTDFTGANLEHASLKNTTGDNPCFVSARGYKLDFSGCSYTRPNFGWMTAPFSTHFRCTYDMPKFDKTDWNNVHAVGSTFLLKDEGQPSVNVSDGLIAACLFYGVDTKRAADCLQVNRASFPGCCFYNMNIDVGYGEDRKIDFSPLSVNDPRLTTEEKEFLQSFEQWPNSSQAMNGIKISPDIHLELDPQKIHTMFSEVSFRDQFINQAAPLFFSHGDILHRSGFHECVATGIATILPERLAARLRVVDAPVIAAVPAGTEKPEDPSLQIPAITFDREQVALQVSALKTASVTEATSIGSNLQKTLIDIARLISEWGMRHLDTSAFKKELDAVIKTIEDYSLQAPPPPVVEEGLEITYVPPPERSWLSKIFFYDPEPPVKLSFPRPQPPAPRDDFAEISKAIDALPDNIDRAIRDHSLTLSDAEKLQKFLETLESAFGAYVEELTLQMKDIEAKNSSIVFSISMRKSTMETARKNVAKMKTQVENLVETLAKDSVTYQWLQSDAVSELNTVFAKAARLHDLALALNKSSRPPAELAGLYNLVVKLDAALPPVEQVKQLFENSRRQMLTILGNIHTPLVDNHGEKVAVLQQILNLG